ncbi:DOPA 4,5-dioxygenase family protein [Kiloniella litopenaei]|uniref:DOPA 4,5-dioxygenase family protein n=1 Tax=Kiloniella litopenaei TaxID=1549748 RepID=UPI003BAB73BB
MEYKKESQSMVCPYDYHVHFYFDQNTVTSARQICEDVRDKFSVPMGRVHDKNVGPHPRWSCVLTVPVEKFGDVISWVSLNRAGLTVFIHPNTGDDLKDHRDHAIWMGEMLALDLTVFD